MRRVVLAIAALLPSLSWTQEPAELPSPPPAAAPGAARVYAFANVGMVFALNDDLDAFGFDHGPALEVGAGFRLARHLALEASAGYLAFSSVKQVWVRPENTPEAPAEQYRFTRDLSSVPLLASVRVSGRWGRVEAHGLGGAGVYFTSLAYRTALSASPSTPVDAGSTSDTSFGVHAGAGVAAALSPDLTIGVEARWLRASATFAPGSTSTATGTARFTVGLDSVVLAGAFAYRF